VNTATGSWSAVGGKRPNSRYIIHTKSVDEAKDPESCEVQRTPCFVQTECKNAAEGAKAQKERLGKKAIKQKKPVSKSPPHSCLLLLLVVLSSEPQEREKKECTKKDLMGSFFF
jgi:hypothetical protein